MATLFGKNYLEAGKSSSPLLLRSNGEIKLLWGNKFLDLIKNGKICSESKEYILTIDDSENIQDNGIYLVTKDNSIWIYIDGTKLQVSQNLDSYISFLTKLELTPELKDLSLTNIGLYYDSIDQVTDISAGVVYIKNENKLYLIKDGQTSEYTVSATIPKDAEFDSIKIGSITIKDNLLTIETLNTDNINCSKIVADSLTNSGNTFSIKEIDGKSILTIDSIKWTNLAKEIESECIFTETINGLYNIITEVNSDSEYTVKCILKYENFFEKGSYVSIEIPNTYRLYILHTQLRDNTIYDCFLDKTLPENHNLVVTFSDGSTLEYSDTDKNFSFTVDTGVTIVSGLLVTKTGDSSVYSVSLNSLYTLINLTECQVTEVSTDYIIIKSTDTEMLNALYDATNAKVYQSRCNQFIQTNTYLALRSWNGTNYDYHTIIGNYRESDFKEGGDTTPKFGLYSDDIKVTNISVDTLNFTAIPSYTSTVLIPEEFGDKIVPCMEIVRKEIKNSISNLVTSDSIDTKLNDALSLVDTKISNAISDLPSEISSGFIVMFDNAKTIPDGWYKCDGTNDTPDLTSMFIRKDPLDDTSDYLVIYIMKG